LNKKEFLTYDQAKKIIHPLKFDTLSEYVDFLKSDKSLIDKLPKFPSEYYQKRGTWISMADFLGHGRLDRRHIDYLTYDQAKKIIHPLKFQTPSEYIKFVKSGRFPRNKLPVNTEKYYKKRGTWISWADFIGNKNYVSHKNRKYITYDQAKKIIHPLKLISQTQWKKFTKSDGFSSYQLPKDVEHYYKKQGSWKNWKDFLGYDRLDRRDIDYLTYDQAKKIVHPLKISSKTNWFKFVKSNPLPDNIPRAPYGYYFKKGTWISWEDFLGHGIPDPKKTHFLTYDQAKKIVHPLKITSQTQWKKFTKSDGFSKYNFPMDVEGFYKRKGSWKNWGDFLGTGTIAFQDRTYVSYDQAKKIIHPLKIQNQEAWNKFTKSDTFPDNVPKDPAKYYEKSGTWISVGDFLGTFSVAPQNKQFIPFYDAKILYQKFAVQMKIQNIPVTEKTWYDYYENFVNDPNLPKSPRLTYSVKRVKRRLKQIKSFRQLQPGIDYYYDFYDTFGIEDPQWTTNKVIGLLKSLLEDDYLLKSSPEILADLIEEKGLDKISSKYAHLLKLIPSQHGNKEFSEHIKKVIQDSSSKELYQTNKFESPDIYQNSDEEILLSDETKIHENTTIDEIISEPEFHDPGDVLEQAQKTYDLRVNRKFMAEGEISLSDDKDSTEFYVRHFVNELWHDAFHNESEFIKKTKKTKSRGKFSDKIRQIFLDEYSLAKQLEIPTDYNFKIKNKLTMPTLMQRYFTLMTKLKPFYANFSGTGAGKTISALLASRVNKSKMTLIVCPNGVVEQWMEVIEKVFPKSTIITKRDAFSTIRDNKEFQYLIINYDQFNQPYTNNNIMKLASQKIDFVILDEIHFSKTTSLKHESKRREYLDKLLSLIRENNTKWNVVGLSATPVVNNLIEGRSLIELISGQEWDDEIKTKLTLRNARKLHKKFTIMSMREEPDYDKPKIVESSVTAKIPPNFELRNLNQDKLALEQLCTEARIPEIIKKIKGKTVIYTEFVGGRIPGKPTILNMLKDAMTKAGFSYEIHTGEDHSGHKKFVENKNVQVLIASKPISTGVDDLQGVCHNLIFNNLPWTHSLYTQVIGRLIRKGQEKPVTINHILADVEFDGKIFAYDKRRMDAIINKKTILDCAVSGVYPENNLVDRDAALKALRDWIKRLEEGKRLDLMRPYRIYDLKPIEVKRREKKFGDFKKFNTKLIMSTSENNFKRIQNDPESWYAYHSALNENKKTWSFDPNEIWIEKISKMKKSFKIGDFGCGEAMIARKFGKHRVQSFDLHADDKELVQECNIKSTPLKDESIDIAVYNLSLMGTDWKDFLKEAKRVLEYGGRLFITDTESHLNGYLKPLRETLEELEFQIYRFETKAKFVMIEAIKD